MVTETKQKLIDKLFRAGGHFGFQKSRRHPSVGKFIFGNKEGTDIIDLEQTFDALEKAKVALKDAAEKGGPVLFVGTKPEVRTIVRDAAQGVEAPFVVNRWVGGTLTNFGEIKKRLRRLQDLVTQGETGELDRKYTKKERVLINREMEKLISNFGGIRKLERTPKMLVVVDTRHDAIAVEEASQLGIPVISISGSDNNLTKVTYPIVVNDALTASVRAIIEELSAVYAEGKAAYIPPVEAPRAPRRDFSGSRGRRDDRGGRRPFSARPEGRHHEKTRPLNGRPQASRAPRAQQ